MGNKRNTDEKEFQENSEEIMKETLQEIYDEVNEGNEEEKGKTDSLEEASDLTGDTVFDIFLDSETAGAEDSADEEALAVETVDWELTAEDSEAIEPEAEDEKEIELHADDGEEMEPELTADDGEDVEPELDEEDGESFEEDFSDEDEEPLSDEEKAARRKKRHKILGITFGSIFGVIAVVYLGFAFFFMSHFYFNTKINEVPFSGKSVKNVEAYMKQQVKDYSLTMKESDGGTETIKGSEINLAYKEGEELNTLLKAQNPFLWPQSLWKPSEITASVGVNFDEAKLSAALAALDCMKEEKQVESESAKPEFDGNTFVVKAEVVGTKIDTENFEGIIAKAISGFKDTLDMTEEKCYLAPKYVSDSPEVTAACETMNTYLTASITYTFSSASEVVDKSVISGWLTVDGDMNVTFNTDQVSQYVQGLADKYNTYQVTRSFTSGNGNTVSVEGGSYGWIIDQDAEYNALLASIQNGEVTTREPAYSQTAATHDGPDWGGTYVEVDLTNQYMWLFVNGSVVVQSDIVTGKPSIGDATPQGAYSIRYCQKNAVLRGPKQPDGTYEWESPVAYWMPFNGGIGLHDASWQAAFGGSRYLTHGSHGCVNLPYSVAQTVFNNVSAGTPVICHY